MKLCYGAALLQANQIAILKTNRANLCRKSPATMFTRVELRVGTVLEVMEFPEALTPAWKLRIDFGPEIGERVSSAQIEALYRREDLVGRQVVAG